MGKNKNYFDDPEKRESLRKALRNLNVKKSEYICPSCGKKIIVLDRISDET